jgi:phosphopantetheinyl transferase (holo-ACP synthase)
LLVIGNDIVDLTAPENRGKSGDRRFRARVFTAAEEEWIDAAPSPDTALWTLWAAKEAAFKTAVKLKPGLTFRHREYAVTNLPPADFSGSVCAGADRSDPRSVPADWVWVQSVVAGQGGKHADGRVSTDLPFQGPCFPDGAEQATESRKGRQLPAGVAVAGSGTAPLSGYGAVMTPAGLVDVLFSVSPFRVHCLALGGNGHGTGKKREPRLHWQEERRSGVFDPSGAVRRAAIHYLAEVLRTSPYFLAIRRPRTTSGEGGTPRVFLEGRETDIDLSLTHDGAYLAFAVRLGHDAGE